jgi:VWFA-related protein
MCPAVPTITFFIALFFIIVAPVRAQDPPAAASDEIPTFKTGVVDVRLDVQVTQGAKLVKKLQKEDFIVKDEGAPQNLAGFAHGTDKLSLLLLLDISGSMTRYLAQISRTAREAMKFLQPGDRVAVMVFAKKSELHQEFSDNLAETARRMANPVEGHDVGAGTQINQAVLDAARYMDKNAGPDGRRAILILTDNLSISYMLPDQRVIKALNEADTVLDAIVVGRGIRPDAKAGQNTDFTPADVFHLAGETGGEAVKADRADTSFKEMVERIRSRYTLAYHAPEAQPGTYRHISVDLTAEARKWYPAAVIHARPGYFVK